MFCKYYNWMVDELLKFIYTIFKKVFLILLIFYIISFH